jgi:hypothetical protein
MSVLVLPRRRRSLRRGVRARCQAVSLHGLRTVGERLLDLSPRGALVACDVPVALGDRLLIGFRAPNAGPWIDTEAEVARIIDGWREGDPGYCAGIRFLDLDRESQSELVVRLAGVPPPVPQRRPPVDYAESVLRIFQLG